MTYRNEELGFDEIIRQLESLAFTEQAKTKIRDLKPYLSEDVLNRKIDETTQARKILDSIGMPPLLRMDSLEQNINTAQQGGLLFPKEFEEIMQCLNSIHRIKSFMERCKIFNLSLAYYADELVSLDEVSEEIEKSIRNGQVDDLATKKLYNIRRDIRDINDEIKSRLERFIKNQKELFSEQFVSLRNGHHCLPVKKEYKSKIVGSVIDKSATGATVFIEPTIIAKKSEELYLLKLDEENEERNILYSLTGLIAENLDCFKRNIDIISELDFIFAKGKLSSNMDAVKPIVNTDRKIVIKEGRHPLLPRESCIPLNFELENGVRGIIITGPNTGGKTVAIKTVGLFCMMAQSGLHLPCKSANVCMNNYVLCDIGDGQNISQNLSTFSAHITKVMDILKTATGESLVILDELGSGTDPLEGMGIAIAILEELRLNQCLFLVTTHYPEVKTYAESTKNILNARMAFDKETLKPLYRLEIGKAGESCALHIAARLGMPEYIIDRAWKVTYGDNIEKNIKVDPENAHKFKQRQGVNRIERKKVYIDPKKQCCEYSMGDSVFVLPEKKIGIVCKTMNDRGELLVMIQGEKRYINHKRLSLNVKASRLYPEDYDFTVIFDTVENRKLRHKMGKRHIENAEIQVEE